MDEVGLEKSPSFFDEMNASIIVPGLTEDRRVIAIISLAPDQPTQFRLTCHRQVFGTRCSTQAYCVSMHGPAPLGDRQ